MNKYTKNVLYSWGDNLAKIAVQFLSIPIILNNLGKDEYGIWITIGGAATFLNLLDFGIANSITRFFARNLGSKKENENYKLFSTSIISLLTLAILTILIGFIGSFFISSIISLDGYKHEVHFIYFFMITQLAICIVLRVGRGILQAYERFDYISGISIFYNLLKLSLIIFLIKEETANLYYLASIYLGIEIARELTLFFTPTIKYKLFNFKDIKFSNAIFKEVFSMGLSSLIMTITGMLSRQGLIIVASTFISTSITPLFYIPQTLLLSLAPFFTKVSVVMMPSMVKLHSEKSFDKVKLLIKSATIVLLIITGSTSTYLFHNAGFYLDLWLSRGGEMTTDDLALMSEVMKFMLPIYALGISFQNEKIYLRNTNQHWFVAKAGIIVTSISILLALFLAGYLKMGIYSLLVAWAIKTVGLDILTYPIRYCRTHKIRPLVHYFSTTKSIFLPGVALSLFASFIQTQQKSLIAFSAYSIIYLVISGTILLYFKKRFKYE